MKHKTEEAEMLYHNLSLWINWRGRMDRLIQASSLPEPVKGEVECALDIHGDNMLDLYRDALVDSLRFSDDKEQ